MTRWFVATTQVKRELIARMNLAEQGFDVFLPVRSVRQPTGVLILRPLVPGYIFVALDLASPRWKKVNSTRGVSRLLPLHLERPEPIPDVTMDIFRERADADGLVADTDALDRELYEAGVMLRVIDGSSAGLQGPVVMDEGRRIVVLLSMFGRQVRARVEPRQVEMVAN